MSDVFKGQKGTYESIGGSYYTRTYYESLNSQSVGIGISYIFNDYKARRDRSLDDGRDSSGGNTGGAGTGVGTGVQ